MKNNTQQPLKQKWTGPINSSGKIHLQGCHSISCSKFPDFSLTFDRFPDRFRRSILAIFIHLQLENFEQIFMRSDLIFKAKSQTINIRKGMFLNIAIYVRKHSFSSIACNLWKKPVN